MYFSVHLQAENPPAALGALGPEPPMEAMSAPTTAAVAAPAIKFNGGGKLAIALTTASTPVLSASATSSAMFFAVFLRML